MNVVDHGSPADVESASVIVETPLEPASRQRVLGSGAAQSAE
jgi:hypothetical protein